MIETICMMGFACARWGPLSSPIRSILFLLHPRAARDGILGVMTMTVKEREGFLAKVDIFARCKKRDIRALARTCEERSYPDGEPLCRQGQRGVAMFLITEGEVRIEEEMDDKSVVVIARLGPGSAVGEMAMIDGSERTASVLAEGEVQALVLTCWDFRAILRARPVVALDILPVIVGRFRETAAELRRVSKAHHPL